LAYQRLTRYQPPITPAEKKKKAASSGLDLTENPRNIRRNLAEHGMLFEDEPTFEAYTEFNKYVKELVGGPRSSIMKEESAQAIRQYLRQNATEPEGDLFGKVVPMVIKDGKSGQESRKRDADGEIIRQAESFGHDEGLKRLCNCQFVKKVLPRRVETAGKKLGLTDPKPDWVFGIREPEFPDRKLPEPGRNARALIGVAPGLQYPWFAIENKGCACPMAEAENQAIRDGATLVSAQRQLAILAGWIDEKTEAVGVDQDNIAFSCTWVPDLAHIFVHWFERKELGAEGDCVYHMNKIRSYLMNDNAHVSDFRKDSHNVLEYGITLARKEKLRKLYHDIAARNITSTSSGTSSAGS